MMKSLKCWKIIKKNKIQRLNLKQEFKLHPAATTLVNRCA